MRVDTNQSKLSGDVRRVRYKVLVLARKHLGENSSARACLASAVTAQNTPPVRSYRIAWKWQRGNRVFGATTLWLCRGDRLTALRDFTAKRPDAISCRIVEEAL